MSSQTRRKGYVGDEVGWMLIVTPVPSDETDGFTLNRCDELDAIVFDKDRLQPVGVHWSELAIQKGSRNHSLTQDLKEHWVNCKPRNRN